MRNAGIQTIAVALALVGLRCGAGYDEAVAMSGTSDLKPSGGSTSGGGKKPSNSTTTTTASPTAASITSDVKIVGGTPPAKTSFPIVSTYDVYAETEYANLSGSHAQTTRWYAPGGSLWQDSTVKFATTNTASSGEVQAALVGTRYQVYDSMPVAGTAIQNYGLSGGWRVDVHLDGAATPIASVSFDLF